MKFDRQRLSLISISAIPLLVGATLAGTLFGSSILNEIVSRNTQPFTITDIIIQALVSTGLGTLVVFSLFWLVRKHGHRARRTFVSFVVSPILTISFFIMGQSLLLVLFKDVTDSILPSVLSLITLGVLLMSFAFILMDSIPSYLRNFFVIFYGSVFGTFLGIIFITQSMFILMISVIIEDYFLTRYSPMAETPAMIDTVGSDPFDLTMIQTQNVAVGVGDYMLFSLISAHSLLFFPIYVWILSVCLALLGIIINITILTRKNEIQSGIPLPAILALVPWVIHILAIAVIGA
ncbi:MAG: hypothetical protein ACW98U_02615 [Candidatus Thorarchaeota archaeon]|jgi:hypothetical protein